MDSDFRLILEELWLMYFPNESCAALRHARDSAQCFRNAMSPFSGCRTATESWIVLNGFGCVRANQRLVAVQD